VFVSRWAKTHPISLRANAAAMNLDVYVEAFERASGSSMFQEVRDCMVIS
jgi:predicted metalloendopeptidase